MQALAKVHAELRAAQIEMDRLREQIKGRDAHISELKTMLNNRADELDRVRAEITARATDVSAKDAELMAALSELAAMREQRASTPVANDGDDLKRIRGVGPGYERILKQQGVTTYAQIAAWTGDDILRIAAVLNTQPGRIVRGVWVEQAAALIAPVVEN